ncbi:MAG: MFS transporter [Pelagibacterium sp.]|uniref:MFS transporter n=1 Tax=Pelagibacterium sp. TaxID=1967288 RepID=UPI0032EB7087
MTAATQPAYGRVIITITLPVFLAIASQTMTAAALPAIGGAMGELARLSWLVIAYMFALTVAGPVYGNLGDMFGRRRVLVSAACIYAIGSFVAILAPTFEWLTVARLIQGIGGGGLMSISQALIGHTVDTRRRGKAQGYVASVGVVASSLGPVIGGGLTAVFGWQSQFVFVLPLAVLAAVMVWRLPVTETGASNRQFDTKGFLLLNAFVGCWVLALEYIKSTTLEGYGIGATLILAGLIMVGMLMRVESRAANPIFPPSLMANSDIARSYALALCHGATLVSFTAFLPLYMQLVWGADIFESSAALLSLTVGLGLGGVLTGNLISRTGRVAIFPAVGSLAAFVLVIVLALFGQGLPLQVLLPMLFFNGLGMGTVMSVVHVTVQQVVPKHLRGAGAGAVTFSRSIGSVLGTAVVTVVLFAAASTQGLDTNLMQVGSPMTSETSRRWAMAFTFAILTIALFAAGGAIAAISSRVKRLDGGDGQAEDAH